MIFIEFALILFSAIIIGVLIGWLVDPREDESQ